MARDRMQSDFQQKMAGATQNFKRQLEQQAQPDVLRDAQRLAQRLIQQLPADLPLGTISAGLMLAALAHAEGASHADRLIEQAFGLDKETT